MVTTPDCPCGRPNCTFCAKDARPPVTIFDAKYQPQAVRTVPAGYHATCSAAVCLKASRRMERGSYYVIIEGQAQHLDCNNAAQQALLNQAQVDATAPPIVKGER